MDLNRTLPSLVPILIPLGAFALAAVLVGMDQLAKHRAREMRHQTIRLMLEKGLPVPVELLQEPQKAVAPRNDLTRGVKLAFTGVGLCVVLLLVGVRQWPVGLILVAIGAGYLVAHALTARQQSAQPPAP